MATPYEVSSVLAELARELGPRKGWAIDEAPGWQAAFADVDIAVLRRACARYLGQGPSKAPNLAAFRRIVAASTTASTLAGCGRCADGLREVAWHHTDPRGVVVVDTFAVRCSCRLGGRVPALVGSLDDVVARMKRSANHREAVVDPRPVDLVPRGWVGTTATSPTLAGFRAALDAAVEDVKRGRGGGFARERGHGRGEQRV